jgi:hypothetical protein
MSGLTAITTGTLTGGSPRAVFDPYGGFGQWKSTVAAYVPRRGFGSPLGQLNPGSAKCPPFKVQEKPEIGKLDINCWNFGHKSLKSTLANISGARMIRATVPPGLGLLLTACGKSLIPIGALYLVFAAAVVRLRHG